MERYLKEDEMHITANEIDGMMITLKRMPANFKVEVDDLKNNNIIPAVVVDIYGNKIQSRNVDYYSASEF